MQRPYDPLTYRHPRTGIEAFGCDADEAVACRRANDPTTLGSMLNYAGAVCLAAATAALVIFT